MSPAGDARRGAHGAIGPFERIDVNTINLAYSDYGSSSGAEAALVAIGYFFAFLFSIVGYLITAFLLMRVFDRAGVQGKWRAWVPIYNSMVLAKLGDVTPWAIVVLIVANVVPIVNIFTGLASLALVVMISLRVNAKFGREWPFLLLFLLGPLGFIIWLGILAFSGNRWNPTAASPSPWASSFLADKTVWDGIPVQPAQQLAGPATGGYASPAQGYAAPPSSPSYPPAGSTPPPPSPPATGTTPPATGMTPPPPAPPAGPQV